MTDPQLAAFYAAAVANPSADAPRIALAAYLDQRGEPWGTYIQTQFQLTQALRTGNDSAALALDEQARAQLRGHSREWSNGLSEIARVVDFSRGLVERIMLDARVFVERSAEIFRLAPIRNIILADVGGWLDAVLAVPQLAQLVSLEFGSDRAHRIGDAGVAKLAACGSLRNLRVLDISFQDVTATGLDALCSSAVLRSLIYVNLAGNAFPSPVEDASTDWATGRDVGESIHLPELGSQLEAKYGPLAWLHPVTQLRHRPPRYEAL